MTSSTPPVRLGHSISVATARPSSAFSAPALLPRNAARVSARSRHVGIEKSRATSAVTHHESMPTASSSASRSRSMAARSGASPSLARARALTSRATVAYLGTPSNEASRSTIKDVSMASVGLSTSRANRAVSSRRRKSRRHPNVSWVVSRVRASRRCSAAAAASLRRSADAARSSDEAISVSGNSTDPSSSTACLFASSARSHCPSARRTQPRKLPARPAKRGTWRRSSSES